MRKLLLAAAGAAALTATPASAVVILGLYNSGVQDGGAGWAAGGGPKPGNGADLHWNLNGGNGGQAFTGSPIHANWLDNDATSQWLTPTPQGDQSHDPVSDGTYVYSLTFDLTGFDPSTATFDGRFAADNLVSEIRLNGNVISGSGGTFDGWTSFASAAGAFLAAENTLEFVVTNIGQADGNPTGLRVEFLNSDVTALSAIPEPATWAMLIGGLGMVGLAGRGRARRRAYAIS